MSRIQAFPTSSGSLSAISVLDQATSATLDTVGDLGAVHTNTGASSMVTLTLPTGATVGTVYYFEVTDADGIKITAPSGETITINGYATAAAGSIQSTKVGATMQLIKTSSTNWSAYGLQPLEQPIETVTLGSDTASMGFSSIPQVFDHIKIVGKLRSDRASSNIDNTIIELNSDTTAGNYHVQSNGALDGAAQDGEAASSNVCSVVPAATSPANHFGDTEICIKDYTGSNIKLVSAYSYAGQTATALSNYYRTVLWNNTAAVTAIDFSPSLGTNLLAGSSLTLIGVHDLIWSHA